MGYPLDIRLIPNPPASICEFWFIILNPPATGKITRSGRVLAGDFGWVCGYNWHPYTWNFVRGSLSHQEADCSTKFSCDRQPVSPRCNHTETLSQVEKITLTTQWCELVFDSNGLWSKFTFTVCRRRLPLPFGVAGDDSRVQAAFDLIKGEKESYFGL